MSNNRIIYNIPKVARNNLQKDLMEVSVNLKFLTEEDIKRYEGLIFISLFNLEQIERYEKFMDLKLEPTWSLEDRRNRILYTILSKSIFSVENLKVQAKIFTNGEIDVVENFQNYSFKIKFTSIVGRAPNIESFINFIDLNKPAHLGYEIEFRYNTHKELKQHKLTHNQLKNYTHQNLYDTRVFND